MISNKELMQRRSQAIPRGVGQIHPIFADRAENCRVWDVEGREYLDFAGGIAVLNTGHLHPKVVAAVEAQLKKLSHTCFQVLAYEPYLELCEIMNQKVPGDFAKKTLLVTTGSEAVENAVKIARAATKRSGTIVQQLLADFLLVDRLALQKLVQFLQVTVRIECYAPTLASIAACTACFLIVSFQAFRYVVMNDKTYIGLVNTHTECNGSYNHINVFLAPDLPNGWQRPYRHDKAAHGYHLP